MGLATAAADLDEAILQAARGSPAPLVPLFLALTVVGGGWALLALVPFLLRRSTRATTLRLLAAVVVTSGLVSLLKALVGRVRPCDALGWCSPLGVASPGGGSFPSGHAAGSFAFAAFVAVTVLGDPQRRTRPWWWPWSAALALLYASLVAWSRCVLGVHYPSDVLAGALLGSAVGALFARPPARRLGLRGWPRSGSRSRASSPLRAGGSGTPG